MKKAITATAAAIILTGCTSTPTPAPYDWRPYVVPLANSQFVTDVQSPDKSTANEYALKAAYGACEPGKPIIHQRSTSRTGLMSEKTAAVYEIARNAANILGHRTPSVNDEEYSAEWVFSCDPVAI